MSNSSILDRLLDSSDDDFHQRIPDQKNSDYFNMFEKIFNMKIDDLFSESESKIDELKQ